MKRREVLHAFVLSSTGVLAQSSPERPRFREGPSVAPRLIQDSAHDNTPQLQAAIDTLHDGGGATLYLPSGDYRIRELKLRENVHLIGVGHVSFKLFNPSLDGYLARIIGQSSVHIENIEFDCTTEAGKENTVGCVEVAVGTGAPSNDISFSDCSFRNAQNNAWLLFRGVEGAKVASCQFLDHLRETEGATHGLSISENSRNVRVADCLFDHPSGYRSRDPSKGHIGIDRATDVWIYRSTIRRATRNGITIEDNRNALDQAIKVRDCVISDCGNSGLQIEGNGLIDLSVEGCDFRDNGAFGIRLASGRQFSARIIGCTFSNNAVAPNLNDGHSQLQISLKPGQVAHVSNCIFRTGSSAPDHVHLYYLNGEASVTDCSFLGGINGFGIYALVDSERQRQRATATFRSLRFLDVGTPTFRLPQFFGDSWLYGGSEPSVLQGNFTKTVRNNRTEQICDIWTPIHNGRDHGAMLISIDVLASGHSGVTGDRFQFTVERGLDGACAFGPVSQLAAQPVRGVKGAASVAIKLLPTDVSEDEARRVRLQIRTISGNPDDNSAVTIAVSVTVLWNGFQTAPVLI